MHPALLVEEILRVIFFHRRAKDLNRSGNYHHAELVSLARTCRAFKDPALDFLWMELFDLSPLVRCLPGACRVKELETGKRMYVFWRNLEHAEMNILQAYARRIRYFQLMLYAGGPNPISPDAIAHLCRLSQPEPLFPNLRQFYLHGVMNNDVQVLLPHVAVQNLRQLTLDFETPDLPSSYEDFMRSLSSTCPGIQEISVHFFGGGDFITFSNTMNRNVRRWTHLQSMTCPDMIMQIDTFFHLSRMPYLNELSFTLDSALIGKIETSSLVFVLPTLQNISLHITSMASGSKFLNHMRLPALRSISMHYPSSPPRDVIRSFAMALRTVCNHKLLEEINLNVSDHFNFLIAEPTTLVLEDILPFSEFNLTRMHIDLDCIINMKDDDLVELASNCPRMRSLFINFGFGWRSAGITPVGLLKVLRLCPSLWEISVALDTHGYQVPLHHDLKSESLIGGELGDPLPLSGHSWFLHLADSVIEAESVPALAAFFADCMPPGAKFTITSWVFDSLKRLHGNWQVYETRWKEVYIKAREMMAERSKHLCNRGE